MQTRKNQNTSSPVESRWKPTLAPVDEEASSHWLILIITTTSGCDLRDTDEDGRRAITQQTRRGDSCHGGVDETMRLAFRRLEPNEAVFSLQCLNSCGSFTVSAVNMERLNVLTDHGLRLML